MRLVTALNTDRLGGVFPRDVVVKVWVVRAAADLEFLADDSHILIRFQEDIWRVAELCNKVIEFKILEMSVTCCYARHSQVNCKQFRAQWDKKWIKKN